MKAALDRITELSAIWGPTRSYVAVIIVVGLAFVHFAQDHIHLAAVGFFILIALLYCQDDESGSDGPPPAPSGPTLVGCNGRATA